MGNLQDNPNDSHLLVFTSLCGDPHTIIGLVCETTRLLVCPFQRWVRKDLVAFCSQLNHLLWGMPTAMLSGEAHVKRN